ncbi:MAG: PIN domain-containing protein [Lewinellaceae bacterium]|nr:PIN domain-containing protein [Lewinellaceae bacterium]
MNNNYRWELIYNDPDDNKFVDCAVAGQADFLVTHDKHFNVLKEIPFPKVEILRLEALKELLEL